MTTAARSLLLRIALAYALALQALLGAIGGSAHAGEMRLAAQLGVICTIHGALDPASGPPDGGDPTPGKLACIEHCLLTGQSGAGALPTASAALPAFHAAHVCALAVSVVAHGRGYPSAAPPPSRGPPVLS
jgi:hypothetical protein